MKKQQRARVVAEADAPPELLPEIKREDVDAAEAAGAVKVCEHVAGLPAPVQSS